MEILIGYGLGTFLKYILTRFLVVLRQAKCAKTASCTELGELLIRIL